MEIIWIIVVITIVIVSKRIHVMLDEVYRIYLYFIFLVVLGVCFVACNALSIAVATFVR